jgi:hypothetical protein
VESAQKLLAGASLPSASPIAASPQAALPQPSAAQPSAAQPSASAAVHAPSPQAAAAPRIAFVVNGNLEMLRDYVRTLSALPEATRAALCLFFSVYGLEEPERRADPAAPPHLSLARALTAGSALAPAVFGHAAARPAAFNSYTRGRNNMWRAVYAAEVARGARFDYWVVADADTHRLECANCARTVDARPDWAQAACCLDNMFGTTLAPGAFGFASAATSLGGDVAAAMAGLEHPRTFLLSDCGDGMFQAMHRDAVPIFLPYHEEQEDYSIWSSQAILFQFTSGCTRGGSAMLGSNMFVYDNQRNSHSGGATPNAVDWGRNDDIIGAAYPALVARAMEPARRCQNPAWAFPPSDSLADAIATFPRPAAAAAAAVDEALTASGVRVRPRVRWNETCAFAQCLAARRERFVRETGGGVPEAPRSYDTYVGWLWGWQGLSREAKPWWSAATSMKGITEDCDAGTIN